MLTRIHHLGIAVRSLDEAVPFYRDGLGMAFQGVEEVPEYAVRVAFLKIGESVIELLEPTSGDGMIARFLAERGPGIHHVAYEVADLEAAIRSCEARGVKMIDRAPRRGAHGARVAFMDPESSQSVLTELCQLRPPRRGRA
ncbi:MAG TPA: methylmalonyl-CoA epimerase [Anaeromyxobacter sp.]